MLHDKRPGPVIGGGLVLIGLGGLVGAAVVHGSASWPALIPGYVLIGVGVGMSTPVLGSAVMSTVEAQRGGMAAGALNTTRQLGFAFGIAALGSGVRGAGVARARRPRRVRARTGWRRRSPAGRRGGSSPPPRRGCGTRSTAGCTRRRCPACSGRCCSRCRRRPDRRRRDGPDAAADVAGRSPRAAGGLARAPGARQRGSRAQLEVAIEPRPMSGRDRQRRAGRHSAAAPRSRRAGPADVEPDEVWVPPPFEPARPGDFVEYSSAGSGRPPLAPRAAAPAVPAARRRRGRWLVVPARPLVLGPGPDLPAGLRPACRRRCSTTCGSATAAPFPDGIPVPLGEPVRRCTASSKHRHPASSSCGPARPSPTYAALLAAGGWGSAQHRRRLHALRQRRAIKREVVTTVVDGQLVAMYDH